MRAKARNAQPRPAVCIASGLQSARASPILGTPKNDILSNAGFYAVLDLLIIGMLYFAGFQRFWFAG